VLLGYPFGLFVRLLMLTAQRRTEVTSAQWADIDLDAATWSLRAADTKAERAHLVPLSGPALEIVRTAPQLGGFLFTSDCRTHIKAYAKSKERLDAFIAAGGEPLAHWTLHDLRRSAATHMVRLGETTEVVSCILNYAAQGVTAQVYALHEFAPEKRHALDAWRQN
jgi:integrase